MKRLACRSFLPESVVAVALGTLLMAACSESNDGTVSPVQDARAEDGEGYDSATRDGRALDVAQQAADAARDGPDSGIIGPTPWADLDCSRTQPSFDCIQQMLVPLEQMPWLVPSEAQARVDPLGTTMGAEWVLSAIHRVAGASPYPAQPFVAETFISPDGIETLSVGGVGDVLAIGGHPHAIECRDEGIIIDTCVDQVPVAEVFDFVLAPMEAAPVGDVIVVRESPAEVGEVVYVVGYPFLDWLSEEQRLEISEGYPFVSKGRVVAVEGMGVVTDAAAFAGNSGGPLLDGQGRVIGVMSSLVGHVRAQGTATNDAWEDWHSLAVAIPLPVAEMCNHL